VEMEFSKEHFSRVTSDFLENAGVIIIESGTTALSFADRRVFGVE
jgi:hypothetical protein